MSLTLYINTTQHNIALLKSTLLYALYNAKVGSCPIYRMKFLRPEPSVFSMLFQFEVIRKRLAQICVERYREVGIIVTYRHKPVAHRYVVVEFLSHFTPQSLLRCFARLNLSARKFVFIACVTVFGAALSHAEIFSVLAYHGRHHV